MVWLRCLVFLKLDVLRLQEWTTEFNLNIQKLTNTQMWNHLYGLNWVFWHLHILAYIARGVGAPLKFDSITVFGDF